MYHTKNYRNSKTLSMYTLSKPKMLSMVRWKHVSISFSNTRGSCELNNEVINQHLLSRSVAGTNFSFIPWVPSQAASGILTSKLHKGLKCVQYFSAKLVVSVTYSTQYFTILKFHFGLRQTSLRKIKYIKTVLPKKFFRCKILKCNSIFLKYVFQNNLLVYLKPCAIFNVF